MVSELDHEKCRLLYEAEAHIKELEARLKDFLDPEYAQAYTESRADTDAELCEYIKGLKARVKELEEERDELRTNIREGVRTLMGHRSSWVRDVASRILARMEYLAGKDRATLPGGDEDTSDDASQAGNSRSGG